MADKFASEGHSLVLIARSKKKLLSVARMIEYRHRVKVLTIAADLSMPLSYQMIYDIVCRNNISVSILVNNVAFGVYGKFSTVDITRLSEMVQVNILAAVRLTKIFIPKMLEAKRGGVLNVSSLAAFAPLQYHAVYCATKAFMLHWSCALHNELEGTGVVVTAVCPGSTDTQFFTRAGMRKDKNLASPETVADAGYDALASGVPVKIVGRLNAIRSVLYRVLPSNKSVMVTRTLLRPIVAVGEFCRNKSLSDDA